MKNLLLLLITLPNCSFGQLNTVLQFVDQYSKESIEVTADLRIEKATFQVDTVDNVVRLERLRGNELKIHFPGYNERNRKVEKKGIQGDTLRLFLVPNDSVLQMRYEAIWLNHSLVNDTINVAAAKSIPSLTKGLTEYLQKNELHCDNGLCSFSNTYYFEFVYCRKEGVYSLESVERIRHSGYECSYLEEHLLNAKNVFPRYFVEAEEDESDAKLTFSLIVTFY